jgi:hypothetical protein
MKSNLPKRRQAIAERGVKLSSMGRQFCYVEVNSSGLRINCAVMAEQIS